MTAPANTWQPKMIDLLVIASYPANRAGLVALFAHDPNIAARSMAPDAIATTETNPDVLVIDLAYLELETAEQLLSLFPGVPAILIGPEIAPRVFDQTDRVFGLLAASADAMALNAAARAVHAGLSVADPVMAVEFGLFVDKPRSLDPDQDHDDLLTQRERQVLQLLAAGLPNKGIARELAISEHTAKFHVGSVLAKLGAASRAEAVMIATRRGLLTV